MFGFLKRRTDLYHVLTSSSDSKGFPPGVAEQMVLKSFKRYIPETHDSRSAIESPRCGPKNVSHKSGHISTWNGGVTQRYRWSQSMSELTVEIVLPARIESKSDVDVALTDSSVSVKYQDKVLVHGVWGSRIRSGESTWIIEDGKSIILSLEKAKHDWWESLLVGDPTIDTSKVESKKRIDEYNPETQAAIRKILHDEHMKRTGQDPAILKLKEAWDADGSPFKGTPFDPSLLSPQANFLPEQS